MKEIIQQILEEVREIKLLLEKGKKYSFEDHNFKVSSNGWKKIEVDKKYYLENPEKDIWEIMEKGYEGEQLFTYESAMRETKKSGKVIPSDEDFSRLLKVKQDMPNIIYSGYRNTDGSFVSLGSDASFWSSLQSSGSAWSRYLNSGSAQVGRSTFDKAGGFSVRCVRN